MSQNVATTIARTFSLDVEGDELQLVIHYTEHRGQGAPTPSLGDPGDIYLDTKTPALFAKCAAGWTAWPGPQVRKSPLAHPVYPDFVLWASTSSRVMWTQKGKMKKLLDKAPVILKDILAAEGRRDTKKRKAVDAPTGGEAKKPRVSEPAFGSASASSAGPSTFGASSLSAGPTPRPRPTPLWKGASQSGSKSASANVSKPPTAPVSTPVPSGSTSSTTMASNGSTRSTPRPLTPPSSVSAPPTPNRPVTATKTVPKPSSSRPAAAPSNPSPKRAAPEPALAAATSVSAPINARQSNANASSPDDKVIAREMEPVKNELFECATMHPSERKHCLWAVGQHIERVVEAKKAVGSAEWWKLHLWSYAASFWHKKTDGAMLERGYRLMTPGGGATTTPSVGTSSTAAPPPPPRSASASNAPPLPKSPIPPAKSVSSAPKPSSSSLPPRAPAAAPSPKPSPASSPSKAALNRVPAAPVPQPPISPDASKTLPPPKPATPKTSPSLPPSPSSAPSPAKLTTAADTSKAASKRAPAPPAVARTSLPFASVPPLFKPTTAADTSKTASKSVPAPPAVPTTSLPFTSTSQPKPTTAADTSKAASKGVPAKSAAPRAWPPNPSLASGSGAKAVQTTSIPSASTPPLSKPTMTGDISMSASKSMPATPRAWPPTSSPSVPPASTGTSKPTSTILPKPVPRAPPLVSSASPPPASDTPKAASTIVRDPPPTRTPIRPPSALPAASHPPPQITPSHSSEPGIATSGPKPSLTDIITLMKSQKRILKSTSSKGASTGAPSRTTTPAARTLSASSSTDSQRTLASPAPLPEPQQVQPAGVGDDRTASNLAARPPSASESPPRRRLPGSKTANERMKDEEVAIARLQNQHAECRSDAASERRGNVRWEAESMVSATLIHTLTMAHAALKLEYDAVKEENARLKGVIRLKSVVQSLNPENVKVERKEEERGAEGERDQTAPRIGGVPDKVAAREEHMVEGDADEGDVVVQPEQIEDLNVGRKEGERGWEGESGYVTDAVEAGQPEERMVVDEDMTQAAQRGEIALESVQGQMTMEIENVKVGRKEEERGAEGERGTDPDAVEDEEGMVVDEDVNQGDTVSNTVEPRQGEASLEIQMVVVEDPNSGDILPNNPQPGQEEAPMEIEEVVNRVAADKVLVKQEPTTSVLLRDTLHGKSKALPEIIDLTLDSDDDEDVAPPRPLITSRTSAPAPPRHCPSQGTESTRTGPSYDMSDHPVPMDIDPVAVDPQPEPSTHLHRQEADPHPGASSSGVRRAAPASAPTLVKPSLAGHFRIVGTDCDYSNTRLREVVLHNDGGTELGSWATILAHLQLLPGGKGPASPPMADPVSVERWSEIYEALRDYYLWYLAPSSDAEPPLANNSEGSVDTIADAMTVDVPSERGICPVTDAAETPSLQLPSSSLGESGIERHIPRVGILLDPATCRSIFAVDKIKAEEIISDGPPPPRQLNRTHKELLFPLCDQELECSSCQVQSGEPESACKYPTTTSLEVLSAHMEEVHSEVLDLLFAQTEGMDDDEIRRWWLEDSD